MGSQFSAASTVQKVREAAVRGKQIHEITIIAFALARYKLDHQRYPTELAALARKYLAKIPPDLFSGKPLIYRPEAKGYLLYSVGPNGKDEDGRGYGDDPKGDDISVRMPLPELPRQ